MASLYRHREIFQQGFTLVELIVVILIIGILSISLIPRFFTVSAYEERQASDDLISALRHTQQLAMNRGGDIQLVLTATDYTVQVSGGGSLRAPDGSAIYKKTFPANVTISPAATITYDRLGRPDAGYVINVGSIQVRVEEETGYAR